MKYTQGRTWNIARNSEKHEKCEIHKQDLGYGNKTEKWGKWTQTLFQLDYGEKTEKRGR